MQRPLKLHCIRLWQSMQALLIRFTHLPVAWQGSTFMHTKTGALKDDRVLQGTLCLDLCWLSELVGMMFQGLKFCSLFPDDMLVWLPRRINTPGIELLHFQFHTAADKSILGLHFIDIFHWKDFLFLEFLWHFKHYGNHGVFSQFICWYMNLYRYILS